MQRAFEAAVRASSEAERAARRHSVATLHPHEAAHLQRAKDQLDWLEIEAIKVIILAFFINLCVHSFFMVFILLNLSFSARLLMSVCQHVDRRWVTPSPTALRR